jgi:hypothetical protein
MRTHDVQREELLHLLIELVTAESRAQRAQCRN